MGGYGALKFAYKYPQLFGDVVAYAAATNFSEVPSNNLDVLAKHNASELRRGSGIRLVVGLAGDGTLDEVREQHKLLQSLSIPHDYEEVPGVGHSLIGLYDADCGLVGVRGLDFHADNFLGASKNLSLQAAADTLSALDRSRSPTTSNTVQSGWQHPERRLSHGK